MKDLYIFNNLCMYIIQENKWRGSIILWLYFASIQEAEKYIEYIYETKLITQRTTSTETVYILDWYWYIITIMLVEKYDKQKQTKDYKTMPILHPTWLPF